MGTSLVWSCPVHGLGVEPFEIAGTKFCASCLASYFKRFQAGHVHELEMTEVEVQIKTQDSTSNPSFVCNCCACVWPVSKGRSCPQCGLEAGEPAPTEIPHGTPRV